MRQACGGRDALARWQCWLHLGQREALRVPGEEAVAAGPLVHGPIHDHVVPKVDDVKLPKADEAVQDGPHRLGPRLLVHGTDADADLGQRVVGVIIRQARCLQTSLNSWHPRTPPVAEGHDSP